MNPSDHLTSPTLLERARNNETEAWRRLVHLYGPLVERWCSHKGVHGPDAEDIRQEVFRAVVASLDTFRRDRPDDSFRGWLRGITRHKILDYYRARHARPEAQGGTDAHMALQRFAEPDFPDDTVDDLGALYRRALELVQSEFETQTWQAFWRAAVEGHTPADIATDLGVTPAAVRKAKSRVLLRLRQELGDVIE